MIDGKVLCSPCVFAVPHYAMDRLTKFAEAGERANLEALGRWGRDS